MTNDLLDQTDLQSITFSDGVVSGFGLVLMDGWCPFSLWLRVKVWLGFEKYHGLDNNKYGVDVTWPSS